MVVQNLAFVANEDRSIPYAANAVMRALVKANVGKDTMLSARLLEGAYFFAVDEEAFLSEAGEEVVIIDWCCYRYLSTSYSAQY